MGSLWKYFNNYVHVHFRLCFEVKLHVKLCEARIKAIVEYDYYIIKYNSGEVKIATTGTEQALCAEKLHTVS